MKEILEEQLALIADRYFELDNIVMLSDRDESYILEYEYLRGKRDILIHLLSICEEDEIHPLDRCNWD